MDLAKYRALFLEEAGEHLAEMSRALLELEKDAASSGSIDVVFRAAHSIKGMAASLDYHAISEIAHKLEDRMEGPRTAGRIDGAADLPLLFRALEGLERMLAVVRETGEPPAADPALAAALAARPAEGGLKKKAPGRR